MTPELLKVFRQGGYLKGLLFNLVIYGLIYHFFGIGWLLVLGITHLNTDQDWTNILIWKTRK